MECSIALPLSSNSLIIRISKKYKIEESEEEIIPDLEEDKTEDKTGERLNVVWLAKSRNFTIVYVLMSGGLPW